MLQQTTVAAVIPYFERWFATFPTIDSLANASEQQVLRAWEGLGYYSRARNLHRAAQTVMQDLGGQFPSDLDALQSLPGIGRYTAGAIRSFAFDLPAPIVEANTERLLARLFALDEPPQSTAGKKALWAAAAELTPTRHVGDFNQAMMDLGSQVCRIADPNCRECPVSRWCQAFARDEVERYPRPKVRAATTPLDEVAIVCRDENRLLLRQRPAGQRWEGMWDLPRVDTTNLSLPGFGSVGTAALPGLLEPVAERFVSELGLQISFGPFRRMIRYGVTRYRVRMLCFDADLESTAAGEQIEWVPIAAATDRPLTRTTRRVLTELTPHS